MKNIITSWTFILGLAIGTPFMALAGGIQHYHPTPPPIVVPPMPSPTPPTPTPSPTPSPSPVVSPTAPSGPSTSAGPTAGSYSSSGGGCVPIINGQFTDCYYDTHPRPSGGPVTPVIYQQYGGNLLIKKD